MYCKVQCDAQGIEKTRLFRRVCCTQLGLIGKYLSSLRKLDHVIAPKEGFETQL